MRALIDWKKRIKDLLANGSMEECPLCGYYSTYAFCDVNLRHYIVKIGATSSFEWQCGHCHSDWMPQDSPINAECYTHNAGK